MYDTRSEKKKKFIILASRFSAEKADLVELPADEGKLVIIEHTEDHSLTLSEYTAVLQNKEKRLRNPHIFQDLISVCFSHKPKMVSLPPVTNSFKKRVLIAVGKTLQQLRKKIN